VLTVLDGDFLPFAKGVADGRYAFWLGSGISFGRFPGLKVIIVKALEHLRARADPTQTNCSFKAALDRALDLANLTATERQSIDLGQPVESWAMVELLRDRLSGQYAAFLDIDIDGEPTDYLVWNAIKVAEVYADDSIAPDAEHYAIAALIKERAVSELPSANWDGLIEKAVDELSRGQVSLKICVRTQDLQAPDQNATLIKFHGCAIRAQADEATYREYLVAAQHQIDGWETNATTRGLAQYLVNVALTKPTLMLGLSAQDANIRKVFALAAATQNWNWPGELPAYVMAEDNIGPDQGTLLRGVYRAHFDAGNGNAIRNSAHFRAFAKPLLISLLLWTLGAKLQRMSRLGAFDLSDEFKDWIDEGIVRMRTLLAEINTGNHLDFIKDLIAGVSRTKRLFMSGRSNASISRYEPLSTVAVSQMSQDAETETNGLAEAAVATATIAHGATSGDWSLCSTNPNDDRSGVTQIVKDGRKDRVFVLSNADAEVALFDSGAVDDDDQDAILIHARPVHERLARSPSRAPGRTGAVGPRRLSMSSLLSMADTPDELMEGFRLEAGL
tara:strand:- start:3168 stop:4847 length:1680 start_codon:yes stop_codon:yes gene_type:complete